jgi:putative tryptophan/tyrosine transport system substrate-binding protein
MNRRDTLFGLLALGVAPRNADAQQSRRTYRVGFLFSTSAAETMTGHDPVHPTARAFVHAMRNLGYREGQNLDLQRRSLEGKDQLGPEIMAELVRHNVEVIIAAGNPAIAAARRATASIPIVMVQTLDPVGAGFIASLARPGGNVTGFTADTGSNAVGKQLQFLQEALPRVRRVAYVGTKADWASERGQNAQAAARALVLNLFLAEHSLGDYSNTFNMIERERADALITSTTTHHFANRNLLAEAALRKKVPSMATWSRDLVDAGCLMSYAMDPRDNFRRAAIYVDKILKGTRPGDLPVEQPVSFELVINLKTARALGVTIATSVLLRADDVIQ